MANEKRLIDANALLEKHVCYVHGEYGGCKLPAVFVPYIKGAPTVDAVEVVRCKDCKHREKSPWHDGYRCGNPYEGMASGVELRDDDFCSYGERREGE